MVLTNPTLEQQAVGAELLLKKSQSELASLRVTLDQSLMTEKSNGAQVEQNYKEAELQAQKDEQLLEWKLGPEINAKISRSRANSLKAQNELEQQRLGVAAKAVEAQIAATQAEVAQNAGNYALFKKQLD